jgi:hypothetical protein
MRLKYRNFALSVAKLANAPLSNDQFKWLIPRCKWYLAEIDSRADDTYISELP